MKFQVTRRQIEYGLVGHYTRNPISRCIEDQLRSMYSLTFKVEIFTLDFVFIDGCITDLPEQCRVLLDRFHRGLKVSPICFELPAFPEDFFRREYKRK